MFLDSRAQFSMLTAPQGQSPIGTVVYSPGRQGPCSSFFIYFNLFLIVLVGSLEKVGACEADHGGGEQGRGNKARECNEFCVLCQNLVNPLISFNSFFCAFMISASVHSSLWCTRAVRAVMMNRRNGHPPARQARQGTTRSHGGKRE